MHVCRVTVNQSGSLFAKKRDHARHHIEDVSGIPPLSFSQIPTHLPSTPPDRPTQRTQGPSTGLPRRSAAARLHERLAEALQLLVFATEGHHRAHGEQALLAAERRSGGAALALTGFGEEGGDWTWRGVATGRRRKRGTGRLVPVFASSSKVSLNISWPPELLQAGHESHHQQLHYRHSTQLSGHRPNDDAKHNDAYAKTPNRSPRRRQRLWRTNSETPAGFPAPPGHSFATVYTERCGVGLHRSTGDRALRGVGGGVRVGQWRISTRIQD